jgi:hypothetical protein
LPTEEDWLDRRRGDKSFRTIKDANPKEGESDKAEDKIEEFLLRKNLKPRGKLLTVQSQAINLWDFDQEFDKKKDSCKMICQMIFPDQSKLVNAKYMSGVLLL